MRTSLLALAILVATVPGCGDAEEAFPVSLCGASRSIMAANAGVADTFKLASETYGKVSGPPARRADLDSLVAAARALARLWSDSSPTTPVAFSQKDRELTDTFIAAAERLRVACPLQPLGTTNVPGAILADKRVHRMTERPVLYWFFGCPKGVRLKYGGAVFPQRGGMGIVLDETAGVADPFTGVLANESYGRVANTLKAACV